MFNLRKRKGIIAALVFILAIMLIVPVMMQTPSEAASKKKPAKVTVTSVKTSGTNKVIIKWRKAKHATNYRIYWKQAGAKKWRTLATVKSNRTSYTHKSSRKAKLVGGKKYVYTVRAYNRYGRKWGAYNSKGKTVKIPKRKAAVPTKTPVKPKPTTPAKPTQPVKPTAVPTQKPKPTVPVIPSPAPEDTPDISGPTSTPTPAPVKVSNVTVNPATVKLTSKGQTTQLSASVLPSNAENKSIVWSTSNVSVATVDNNGVVTAVANGNATIIATAADGSGKYAECSVVVEMPKENNQVIELAGGESKKIGITKSSFQEIIDFSKVTFDCKNAGITYEIGGFDYISTRAAVSIKALRKGNGIITASYENRVIARWTINVTSDWTEYLAYVNWRKQIESQIWTANMSQKEKMKATESYIKYHYGYENGSSDAVKVYLDKTIDCHAATEMMGDFAKDINLQVKYVNAVTGNIYDYKVKATSEGGHTYNLIFVDNNWEKFDATPTP